MDSLKSSIFFFLFLCFLAFGESIHTADVHRLFQMERANISFGSQKTSLNLLVQSVLNSDSLENDYQQKVAIIKLADFSIELLENLISRNAEAILILFPEQDEKQDVTKWHQQEIQIFQKNFKVPIYFAIEDAELLKMYRDTSPFTFFDGYSYQLVVSQNEASSINDFPILNLQGKLYGKVNESEGNTEENYRSQRPAIVLVSSGFHSFSISPSFVKASSTSNLNNSFVSDDDNSKELDINNKRITSTGYASTATSLIGLLEVSRLFSKLYSNSKTQSEYDILFLITGGGFSNYAGDNHWINAISDIDSYLLNSIHFILCIDSLASNSIHDKLYLHTSKLPKDPNVAKFYNVFDRTAQQMNIQFEIVHKKIDFSKARVDSDLISDVEYDWEHELFSTRRFLSATLSTSSQPIPSFSKSHLFDTLDKVDIDKLLRNIHFLAESIAKYVYSVPTQQEIEIFGNEKVNREFVESWMRTLTDSSMSVHQRSIFNSPPKTTNKLIQGIEQLLQVYTNEVINQTFTLDSVSVAENFPISETTSQRIKPANYRIFGGNKSTLALYKTKPVSFDIFLAIGIYSYLLIAYAILKGPAEAFLQLKALLNLQKASSKKKYK